ncbi:MAG: DUF4012 domain-containing protein [Candidatus Pacebacteria bacterium]|nr:DUF4012 domain-containing protein [Candidatus Paceibacterota bacterium]
MFTNKQDNFNKQEEFKRHQWGDFVVDLKSLAKKKLEETEKDFKKNQKQSGFSWLYQLFTLKKSSGFGAKFKKVFRYPLRISSFLLWLILSWLKLLFNVYLLIIGKKKLDYLKYYYQLKKINFFKKIRKKSITAKLRLFKPLLKFKEKKAKQAYLKNSKAENFWPEAELKNIHKELTVKKDKELKQEDEFKNYRRPIWKKLGGFLLVILFLIIPFHLLNYYNVIDIGSLEAKILHQSESALDNLKSASEKAQTLDMRGASNYFSQAGEDFSQAQKELAKIDKGLLSLASLSNNPKIKLASQSDKILEAGILASNLGEEIGLAFSALLDNQDQEFALSLQSFSKHAKEAASLSASLQTTLEKVNLKSLPEDYAFQLENLQSASLTLSNGLKELASLADNLQPFLEVEKDKRYLLIFQNNSELRAGGGFMGSFALADVRKGKIVNLEVPKGGTYDTEAGLLERIEAPEPLWLVNPRWYFWDANWWPDWKKSAQNIAWFYEKSDGPTVDGVIGFTPTFLEELLKVIGPVSLPEYGLEISADNFWQTVQPIVEEKTMTISQGGQELKVQNTQPKKIIGDLMFKILEEMPKRLDSKKVFQLLQVTDSLLAQKQALFYFTDDKLQKVVEDNNWAGRIKASQGDYLAVINTNIAGQKTDRLISQEIEHKSEVQIDGSIINTVEIHRYHHGVKRTEFTGVRNVNWLRVYVPLGSELLSASGFSQPDSSYFDYPEEAWLNLESLKNEKEAEIDSASLSKIYKESGKTVFANWTMLDPGESQVIVFKYKLPFNFYNFQVETNWQQKLKHKLLGDQNQLLNYSLLLQKQAGDFQTNFSSRLEIKASNYELENLWIYPERDFSDLGWEFEGALDSDKYFSALWQLL